MTSKNFVIWLRGFSAAANNFTLTPEQWDTLKDELAQVKDDEYESDDELENDFFGYEVDDYDKRVPPCVGHALESDEEETNKRMDVIGQNGNEGTHYWTSTNTGKQLLKD
jgi:hypothetical protein